MDDLFGTHERQARALARKENPKTSKDAALKMVKSGALNRQELLVYASIFSCVETLRLAKKPIDFTTKDIAKQMYVIPQTYDKAYDICRKRFSGLAKHKKIKTTGGRRDGCQIWELL